MEMKKVTKNDIKQELDRMIEERRYPILYCKDGICNGKINNNRFSDDVEMVIVDSQMVVKRVLKSGEIPGKLPNGYQQFSGEDVRTAGVIACS